MYAAAILLSIVLGVSAYHVGIRRGVSVANIASPQPAVQKQSALEEQLRSHEREIARVQLQQRDGAIAELQHKLRQATAALKQLKSAEDQLEHEIKVGSTRSGEDLVLHRTELVAKLTDEQANVKALQRTIDALEQQSSQDAAHTKALEAKVNNLAQQLHDRDGTVDQQRELLAHDRDIRELMGARDLYIAEVYDVARTGATRKPYGRVFYTKGRSLIFYAYDLNQEAGLKNARTFQAWGRCGPDNGQALSLGIFYEDNAAKKRWVLKLDDAKTLAQIDAVFVTVEPNGGSQKPSGQPLLFTYLRVDPNHP